MLKLFFFFLIKFHLIISAKYLTVWLSTDSDLKSMQFYNNLKT